MVIAVPVTIPRLATQEKMAKAKVMQTKVTEEAVEPTVAMAHLKVTGTPVAVVEALEDAALEIVNVWTKMQRIDSSLLTTASQPCALIHGPSTVRILSH